MPRENALSDDALHTEYRVVLQRIVEPPPGAAAPAQRPDRSPEPDGSLGRHLARRWLVTAALTRRYAAGAARAWPVLLPARRGTNGEPGDRRPPADLADLFPRRGDKRPIRRAAGAGGAARAGARDDDDDFTIRRLRRRRRSI